MIRCSKGHSYPESLKECPVCQKENELKTVIVSGGGSFRITPRPQETPVISPPDNKEDDFCKKTVILNRALQVKDEYLCGWLVELDDDDRPVGSCQLFNKKTTVGRRKGNDIVLSDDSVSSEHCMIDYNKGEFVICDNNSSNRTFVDKKQITSLILKDNSLILLGRLKFRIKYL